MELLIKNLWVLLHNHSGIEWTVENINRVIKVLEPLLDEMEDDE